MRAPGVAIAAALALAAGLALTACSTGVTTNPQQALSPAPGAAQGCPGVDPDGPTVPSGSLPVELTRTHPASLPSGLGLLLAWNPGSLGDAGAIWADERCRTVRLSLFAGPGKAGGGPAAVGPWRLTRDEQCSNGVLNDVTCLQYEVSSAGRLLVVDTVGLARSQGDDVVASIPLGG